MVNTIKSILLAKNLRNLFVRGLEKSCEENFLLAQRCVFLLYTEASVEKKLMFSSKNFLLFHFIKSITITSRILIHL
jgi:hypothetical protein